MLHPRRTAGLAIAAERAPRDVKDKLKARGDRRNDEEALGLQGLTPEADREAELDELVRQTPATWPARILMIALSSPSSSASANSSSNGRGWIVQLGNSASSGASWTTATNINR